MFPIKRLTAIDSDVESSRNKFIHTFNHVFVLLKVNDLYTGLLLSEGKSRWDAINSNDT